MRRGETNAVQPVNLCEVTNELAECPAVAAFKDGRIAVIRVDVLAKQIDFAHTFMNQRTCFGDDCVDIAREFRAACVWHHAECAEFIAAFLNGEER